MTVKKEKLSAARIMKFIIPSVIGVLLLMTPFKTADGGSTVAVSVISKFLNTAINSIVPIHVVALTCITISTLLALIYTISKPD